MRQSFLTILILVSSLFAQNNNKNPNESYFGQKPVGDSLQIFAPGFISTDNQEHSALVFSKDEKEIYWSIWELPAYEGRTQKIRFTKYIDNKWTDPKDISFTGKYMDGGPVLSPDNQRLYFYSNRPPDQTGEAGRNINIWYCSRVGGDWSTPVYFDLVNTNDHNEVPGSFTAAGDFYFVRGVNALTNPGNINIHVCRNVNGELTKDIMIEEPVRSLDCRDSNPWIAPDESFLIYSKDCRVFTEAGEFVNGERSLCISFNDNGKWMEPVPFPEIINGKGARFASLSPDGKHIFFTRFTEDMNEDYYWISSEIIDKLKKTDL